MKSILYSVLLCFLSSLTSAAANTDNDDIDSDIDFDDAPLIESITHPEWFKRSCGYLSDDLHDALDAGKKGLIVYFGQDKCAYCDQLIKNNLGASDIEHYIRKNYDIIAMDIWSSEEIVDTDEKEYTQRELSIHYKANFTPSLIFYNRYGKPVFRLRGYYPPYKFRAALKYAAEGFYKTESFRAYLTRAKLGLFFLEEGLNERDFFIAPPYDLKATTKKTQKPLMVAFEQGNCHTCDLLHSSPLNQPEALEELKNLNSIQLNMWTDTPVVTPGGKSTTAKDWAKELGLFYAPTLIFFDSDGKEIIRIDSVVNFYRLLGVLKYVNQGGYLSEPNFQSWRLKQRKTK
ncbi:MAG: thioredoxin fold domain-containing protein [Gammaproteobacteria bacterium]|nr:thioredoxin fold domain-containing protein [Gammaproteobacteria bacterium]